MLFFNNKWHKIKGQSIVYRGYDVQRKGRLEKWIKTDVIATVGVVVKTKKTTGVGDTKQNLKNVASVKERKNFQNTDI